MGLFFNADKYITNVESPRVNRSLSRKEQIISYIEKYYDMFTHEYLEDVFSACITYIEETVDDQEENTKSSISTEIQAVTTIIKGLQDFVGQKRHEDFKYMRILAAKEAFKLYCAMISKTLEYNIIDKKQARRRISNFYRQCGL
ncbi:MAG: hypothetical protein IJU77_03300 [Butyrivibrio sp.]|nr:hypothetical protein [Butyrivibrio sp.]